VNIGAFEQDTPEHPSPKNCAANTKAGENFIHDDYPKR